MRVALLLISALLCAGAGFSADPISRKEYRQRRLKVQEKLLAEDGLLVLMGAVEDEQGDLRERFRQHSDFYYLTGWTEPNAILMLSPNEEFLFLPARNEVRERYTGRKVAPEDADATSATGFANVLPVEKFELTFFLKLEETKKVLGMTEFNRSARLRQLVPKRPMQNAAPIIWPMRMLKSPAELKAMQRAIDVTIAAHLAAWKRVKPGLWEYQIAATMTAAYFNRGCDRSAYPPIVGSGPNSTVLHYARNDRRMDSGEVLLMDVGAECYMYAADITRTVPVNGEFSKRQREIYEVVLGAQKAAIAAVKPGMTLAKTGENSLHKVALDYMNSHGKTLRGEPIGTYFAHGIGHQVGLDVHDPGNPNVALEPGMVITIEPGIYIPEEGIGIRIEDMVLVTETGCRVLSDALPKEVEAVEQLLHAAKPAQP